MKCANCGAEVSASERTCSRCGMAVPQGFNYSNMEKELLHTVWEEETIHGISDGSMLYGQAAVTQQKGMSTIKEQNAYEEMDDLDETDQEPVKQPGKLVLSLLAAAAAFGGLAFLLSGFQTDYVYGKTEETYKNCLDLMAKEDYPGAMGEVETLLLSEPDSLAYLALTNTITEKSGERKEQKMTLYQLIKLDTDNYEAYERLLEMYLESGNQEGIEKLAADAPNSAIAAMLSEYLVDTPYLELTPGVYDASQTLAITSERGNSIYYTLDGSSPQEKGILYSDPIPLEHGYIYTVRAVCKNERGAFGDITSGDYQIGINAVNYVTSIEAGTGTDGQIAEPQVYPASGTYTTQQRITIDVPIGYQAYYSWISETELTPENGTLYTGGITMPEGSSVLSVILTDGNGSSSLVKQVSYTYQP